MTHHPTPSEVWLILEIADTSLNYDRGVKATAYAQAGIEDYWVLDVIDRRLHVFRQPAASGYQQELILAETLTVRPIAFPELEISIQDLLPPINSLKQHRALKQQGRRSPVLTIACLSNLNSMAQDHPVVEPSLGSCNPRKLVRLP
ncbi:MAG: hypothetical protein B0A82_21515 [Alkalinema sp. CACIAM 70d]|nr:MAG: hypothetical protein B0A82_21515 [Alkalinema sp. CACIAM 70d]